MKAQEEQQIMLDPGWNLVALQVEPLDTSPEAVFAGLAGEYRSAWTYSHVTGQWLVHFNAEAATQEEQLLQSLTPLTDIAFGRPYWVYLNATGRRALSVVGARPSGSAMTLVPGWNFVAIPAGPGELESPVSIASALAGAGAEYQAILMWEAGTYRVFTQEESDVDTFTLFDPDKGYWVRLLGQQNISLEPVMLSSVREDVDIEPTGNFPGYEDLLVRGAGRGTGSRYARISGSEPPLGPRDQTHIAFFEGEDVAQVSISNSGGGVLLWQFEWFPTDRPDSAWLRLETTKGVTTIESDVVTLYLDRTELTKGTYSGTLRLTGSDNTVREWTVVAEVPGLSGAWRGAADIETVNGRRNLVPHIDLHLDIFEDEGTPGFLRGMLDSTNSLLWPVDVPLAGHVLTENANQIALSGSYILGPGDQNLPPYTDFPGNALTTDDVDWNCNGQLDSRNPLPFPVQRSLTLVGTLTSGTSLPFDPETGLATNGFRIEGTYIEVVYGMLREPIELRGDFTLTREGPEPFLSRRVTRDEDSPHGVLPVVQLSDETDRTILFGQTLLTPPLSVMSDIVLQDVEVHFSIDGTSPPPPSDLRISLISPNGTELLLHDRADVSPAVLQDAAFPNRRPPAQPFAALLGNGSKGDWRLRIQNTGSNSGILKYWRLRLQGQPVFDVHGVVVDAATRLGLPAEVTLQGAPFTRTVQAGSDGSFVLRGIPGFPINLSASIPGYVSPASGLGVINGRPTFADCAATLVDEAARAAAFRPLPGIPVPSAAVPGYSSQAGYPLGSATNPLILELLPDTNLTELTLLATPFRGAAPHQVDFLLLDPLGEVSPGSNVSWDFGDGDVRQGVDLRGVSHTYAGPAGVFTASVLADGHQRTARIEVAAAPGDSVVPLNVFQPTLSGGAGVMPSGLLPQTSVMPVAADLLMIQHADSANFDIDRAPYLLDRDVPPYKLFASDGVSGSGPDAQGIFRGEDTDYATSYISATLTDPCDANLDVGDGAYHPYPVSVPSGTDCGVERFRVFCNIGATIIPNPARFVRDTPDPGPAFPPPALPQTPDADGIAKSRGYRVVTGPLAQFQSVLGGSQ